MNLRCTLASWNRPWRPTINTHSLLCFKVLFVTLNTFGDYKSDYVILNTITHSGASICTVPPLIVNNLIVVFIHLCSAPGKTKVRVSCCALIISGVGIDEWKNAKFAIWLNCPTCSWKSWTLLIFFIFSDIPHVLRQFKPRAHFAPDSPPHDSCSCLAQLIQQRLLSKVNWPLSQHLGGVGH